MLPKKDSHDKKVMCFDDVSWRSLLQYLNTKFPLEYVYSGDHVLLPNWAGAQEVGSTIQNQGRQSTEVVSFLIPWAQGEDIVNPESEFGFFFPFIIFFVGSRDYSESTATALCKKCFLTVPPNTKSVMPQLCLHSLI